MASPGLVQIYMEGKGHGLRGRARKREWERRMGKKEVKKKAEERGKRKEGGEGMRNKRKGKGERDGREGLGKREGERAAVGEETWIVQCHWFAPPPYPCPSCQIPGPSFCFHWGLKTP